MGYYKDIFENLTEDEAIKAGTILQSNAQAISEKIPTGRDKAVTLSELEKRTGLDGRSIRKYIETLRRNEAILNLQDGKGYFRPEVPKENDLLSKYIKQETNRAKKTFYNLYGAKKTLERSGGNGGTENVCDKSDRQ